jgi:ABC-type histidine transport system ATPase subunit
MKTILNVDNIVSGYGQVEIVKGVSLKVSKDENRYQIVLLCTRILNNLDIGKLYFGE